MADADQKVVLFFFVCCFCWIFYGLGPFIE
jgi:hypothetical protein